MARYTIKEIQARLDELNLALRAALDEKERLIREAPMQEPVMVRNFPVIRDMALVRREEHLDIPFTISNHRRLDYTSGYREQVSGPGTWCYYVHISEYMLPVEQFEEFWLPHVPNTYESGSGIFSANYDYSSAPFAGVSWHGGVTYYAKKGGLDGEPRSVKIGCDWAHHYDEGHKEHYTYDDVKREAIETVSELAAKYSFFRRCPTTGSWQPQAEMVESGGKLCSVKAKALHEKWDAERAARAALAKVEG